MSDDEGLGGPVGADTGRSRSVLGRFVRALGRNPDQPVHKWPVWAPFIMATVLTYAAYFTYGVFIAGTDQGRPEAEAQLTVRSCSPNWLLFGARSYCAGTIVTPGGKSIEYRSQFSEFAAADIGRETPVYGEFEGFSGRTWKSVRATEPAVGAKLVIGPLFIGAVGFWYLFVVRTVIRGAAMTVKRVRGK